MKLAVGQRVVALRDIWYPDLGIVAKTGDEGRIAGVGVDAEFGWAQVQFPGMTVDRAVPLQIAPTYTQMDPHARIIETT